MNTDEKLEYLTLKPFEDNAVNTCLQNIAFAMLEAAVNDCLDPKYIGIGSGRTDEKKQELTGLIKRKALNYVNSDDIEYVYSYKNCCMLCEIPHIMLREAIQKRIESKTYVHKPSEEIKRLIEAVRNHVGNEENLDENTI